MRSARAPTRAASTPLGMEVNDRNGEHQDELPGVEVWEMRETCALDVADRDGETPRRGATAEPHPRARKGSSRTWRSSTSRRGPLTQALADVEHIDSRGEIAASDDGSGRARPRGALSCGRAHGGGVAVVSPIYHPRTGRWWRVAIVAGHRRWVPCDPRAVRCEGAHDADGLRRRVRAGLPAGAWASARRIGGAIAGAKALAEKDYEDSPRDPTRDAHAEPRGAERCLTKWRNGREDRDWPARWTAGGLEQKEWTQGPGSDGTDPTRLIETDARLAPLEQSWDDPD